MYRLAKQGEMVVKLVDSAIDETAQQLIAIQNNQILDDKDLQNLKRRKLIQQSIRKSYKITKGPEFKLQRVRKVAELTKEMLGNKAEVSNCIGHVDQQINSLLCIDGNWKSLE